MMTPAYAAIVLDQTDVLEVIAPFDTGELAREWLIENHPDAQTQVRPINLPLEMNL